MTDKPKVILITGSTDGIGFETARQLANRGHRVILHGRNNDRLERALKKIRSENGLHDMVGIQGDLASFNQISRMADHLYSMTDHLDVLVNNAGVIMKRYAVSDDGYEMTFAINHLAHFYLTGLVLPLLAGPDPARIINISSGAQSQDIDLDTLLVPDQFRSMAAYSQSKLCNVLFTYRLARLMSREAVTVNAQHPGVINTKMLRSTWGPFGAPVEQGAENEIYLAVSDEVESITGTYFDGRNRSRSAGISYDTGVQDALWDFSLDLLDRSGFKNPYSTH